MKKVKVFWEKVGGFEKMTIMKYRKYKGLECREAIILWGGQNIVYEINELMYLFNINVDKIITYICNEDEELLSKLFLEVSDKCCILVAEKSNLTQYNKLRNIGFSDNQIYFCDGIYNYYSTNNYLLYRYGFDPNIGYTKFDLMDNSLGITTLEYNNAYTSYNEVPIKILALGSSTTNMIGVRERQWVYFLHEILKRKNISHLIYCAGMEAYTVSSELLKLIRDGLQLSPDICISYTGTVNQMHRYMENHGFVHYEQYQIFKSNLARPEIFGLKNYTTSAVDYGVENNLPEFDFFISQLRIMYAVCTEFKINYVAFLEPNLLSKRFYYEDDLKTLAASGYFMTECGLITDKNRYEKNYISSKRFRECAIDIEKKYSYIHNLTGVFDNIDSVYIDLLHLCERGNEIIASKIYSIIENDIYECIRN